MTKDTCAEDVLPLVMLVHVKDVFLVKDLLIDGKRDAAITILRICNALVTILLEA